MKDMFDCLEESYNPLEDQIFLIKVVKNKKKQKRKIYYLETIYQDGRVTWTSKKEESICLLPPRPSYIIIRNIIREYKIECQILRIPYLLKPTIIGNKPVRKEKWWGRIKVWFFRKFWIPIGK